MYYARLFRIRIALVVLLPLLLPRLFRGQATRDNGLGPSADTLVKNVDEVSVDFVVRNKNMSTLNLKAEDIVVTDDGSVVKLQDLHLVTKQPGANHLVTLLFDPLDPSAATNAREIAKKILKVIPVQDFSFSVFSIDQRLRLFQEFTANPEKILQAVNAATNNANASREQAAGLAEKSLISSVRSGGSSESLQASIHNPEMQKAMLAALTESRRIVQDQHTQGGLAGLLALVHSQTAIRGRKLLIYFTDGLQPDANASDTLRSIAGAADRAEISIYVINKTAVDTKSMEGLMQSKAMGALATYNHFNPQPTGIAAQRPTVFTGGMIPQVNDQITRVETEGLAGNSDPLSQLAVHTGGAYLFSQDNMKKFFQQAVEELTTYYEASYVPSAQVYDGKFHQITIKPVHSGLKLQTRAGYFAVPPAAGIMAFEAPMVKLFSDQSLPADLAFENAVLQVGNMATGNENTLVVEVPISGLEIHRDPNANLLSWHLSVMSQIKDKTGTVVAHFSEDIPGHGALDAKDQQACATMQRHFTLPPGDYTIETAVGDRNSGKMGAKRTQLQIPNTASVPFLSDVALVRRVDPYPVELDPFEPLRYQQGKIVPNVSHQIITGAQQSSFFFLVHANSSASESAMLEMRVARNGQLMGQVPLQLPKDLGEDAFPYIASLKTSSLPAGDYDVTVSLTQGAKIIERQASFKIPGLELASATPAKESLAPNDKANENVTDSDSGTPEIAAIRRQPLVITSLPSGSVARPSDDELNAIIEGARNHALSYTAKLPNFVCLELTDRSVDSSGNGRWRRKDSFGEMLRYLDNQETRKVVEVNGRPSSMERSDINGPLTLGEFGVLLGAVFRPASRAEFRWKESDALGSSTVQVFEYRVDRKNDSMSFTDSNGRVYAGYHGLAYIDNSTFGVRRITMEADNIPDGSSIHAAAITIDYDYVLVGTHDYLMPVRGTIRVHRGRHEVDLNQIVFQDYRRYASQAKVIVQP